MLIIISSIYPVAINLRVGIDPLIWASDVSVSIKITERSLIYLLYLLYLFLLC